MTENCQTNADDDCSGTTNDLNADNCTVLYADVDGDLGDAADSVCQCAVDLSTVYTITVAGDCDDNDNDPPLARKLCHFNDEDCDGSIKKGDGCVNYFYDADMDGYGTALQSVPAPQSPYDADGQEIVMT